MRELIHRAFEGKGTRRLAGTAEHGGRRDMFVAQAIEMFGRLERSNTFQFRYPSI